MENIITTIVAGVVNGANSNIVNTSFTLSMPSNLKFINVNGGYFPCV